DYFVDPFSVFGLRLTWDNYLTMISQFKILNLFKNSFIISFFTILLLLSVGIVASYAFAKLNFKWKNVIYLLVISTMFIPVQATIIPMYLLFSRLHLVNTFWSVIFMYVGMFIPEVILLMTSGFRGIPDELIEAAKLDGAGYFDVIRYVIIPMGRPAILLSVIFYFIVTWNDLFTPMILLQSMDKRTVMVALAALLSRYSGDPTFQFAGLVLASIPAILVYAIFQRFIIKGISMGSTK
ncbi:MAG TPA: carbohydrate ABC transporter permease, partial [candidate division Zixibacteria bacterium]|nr:carbohydrate ABC transporter permease [candidate division Zixibacteria bacterium]